MHWAQSQFIRHIKSLFPCRFENVSVLEIGAYDVNGSVRQFFQSVTRYVGLDLIPGPGVDEVCSGHLYAASQPFDIVISSETFEHDPYYWKTFVNMVNNTRPNGMVVFTCASTGRPEHGTPRTDPSSSPGTANAGQEYYRNLIEKDFDNEWLSEHLSIYRFFRNRSSYDLYFIGFKRSEGPDEQNVRHAKLIELDNLCTILESVGLNTDRAFSMLADNRNDALLLMQTVLESTPIALKGYVLSRQAWLLRNAGFGEKAVNAVREALTLMDTADLHWQLATILQSLDCLSEAVVHARLSVARAPTNPRYICSLGAMLNRQNHIAAAEDALSRALLIDPNLSLAYQQLSTIRAKQERWDDALALAGRAAATASPTEGWITTYATELRERIAHLSETHPKPYNSPQHTEHQMNPLLACFPVGTQQQRLTQFDWQVNGVDIPYMIFMTGRCGSTLLTHLLKDAGLCGVPDELFNETVIPTINSDIQATTFSEYFQSTVSRFSTNSRWGVEIDPQRFRNLCDCIEFGKVFGPATKFFWMTRVDIASQAWSYARAKKTGLWHTFADGSQSQTSGNSTLSNVTDAEWWAEIIQILINEAQMEAFFGEHKIVPCRLYYESLVTDRDLTVITVLNELGCSPSEIAECLPRLADRTVRQSYRSRNLDMINFVNRFSKNLAPLRDRTTKIDISALRNELKDVFGVSA